MDTKTAPTAEVDQQALAARKRRNMWLALALFGFVVLLGVGTAIRIQQGAGTKPCNALYWEPVKQQCLDPELPDLEAIGREDPD